MALVPPTTQTKRKAPLGPLPDTGTLGPVPDVDPRTQSGGATTPMPMGTIRPSNPTPFLPGGSTFDETGRAYHPPATGGTTTPMQYGPLNDALPFDPNTGGTVPIGTTDGPIVEQPVPQPEPQPQPGGGGAMAPGTQPFGPDENLVGTQINPGQSPAGQYYDDATRQAAEALGNQPSRSDLATQQYDLLLQALGDVRQQGVRDIGRAASTFGRIGSGAVTTDLGNLEERIKTIDERGRSQLAADAAGLQRQDILDQIQATSGLGEREFNRGLTGREELRGERGYQYGLSQDAIQNAVQQLLLEQGVLGGQQDLSTRIGELLAQYGFTNNPADPYLRGGYYYGG